MTAPRFRTASDLIQAYDAKGSDALYLTVAATDPDSAGAWYDAEHKGLVVSSVAGTRDTLVYAAVKAAFASSPVLARLPIVGVQQAQFRFTDLASWRQQLRAQIGIININTLAIDPQTNSVLAEVSEPSDVDRLRAASASAGTPAPALRVAVRAAPVAATLLTDPDHPFRAGFQIQYTRVVGSVLNAYSCSVVVSRKL